MIFASIKSWIPNLFLHRNLWNSSEEEVLEQPGPLPEDHELVNVDYDDMNIPNPENREPSPENRVPPPEIRKVDQSVLATEENVELVVLSDNLTYLVQSLELHGRLYYEFKDVVPRDHELMTVYQDHNMRAPSDKIGRGVPFRIRWVHDCSLFLIGISAPRNFAMLETLFVHVVVDPVNPTKQTNKKQFIQNPMPIHPNQLCGMLYEKSFKECFAEGVTEYFAECVELRNVDRNALLRMILPSINIIS